MPNSDVVQSTGISVETSPEATLLYHIEPFGIGTPFAESLSSYLANLAKEHCCSVLMLFKHAFIPLLRQVPIQHSQSATYANTEPRLRTIGVRISGINRTS